MRSARSCREAKGVTVQALRIWWGWTEPALAGCWDSALRDRVGGLGEDRKGGPRDAARANRPETHKSYCRRCAMNRAIAGPAMSTIRRRRVCSVITKDRSA